SAADRNLRIFQVEPPSGALVFSQLLQCILIGRDAQASITARLIVAREHRRTQSDSASIAKRLSVTQSLHYRALIVTSRFVSRSLVTWKPCLNTPAISKFLRRGPRAWKAW